ncbi:MAG: SPOR domain-containing protein [Candidatus Cryptobacteroides sp.]
MEKTIRRIVVSALLALAAVFQAAAQKAGSQAVDSVALSMSTVLDSALVGKSIFSILPASGKDGSSMVTVHQSDAVQKALNSHVSSNGGRKISGYRVRIFSDNKQDARSASELALATFKSRFPGCPAYRTYTNPFFKVTVGDFRTKSEAMYLLQQVKSTFPTAFIVPETINYPALNRSVVFNSVNTGN